MNGAEQTDEAETRLPRTSAALTARPTSSSMAAAPDWRHDADFRWPERHPWSTLSPQFHLTFGRSDPSDPQPEHLILFGQNGTGKTHALGKIYQERAYVTGRASILAAHKPIDRTMLKLGWPIANTWEQLVKLARDGYVNVIYWPRTRLMGGARDTWYDHQFMTMFDNLWSSVSGDNTVDTDIVMDDTGYVEDSLPLTMGRIRQFLREGRAPGFSLGLAKQRVQGGSRLEASETQWTLGFRPKDDDDLERWAQLFGARRDWMPVFRSLDREKREFVIKHTVTQDAYITWIDEPLAPREPRRRRRHLLNMLRAAP